jgi:sulfoxide reductase heme-binding subunit YedZ
LHRSIYGIAILAVLHYLWHKAGKNDFEVVSIYAGIIFLLLVIRVPIIQKRLTRTRS